jgi:hypothetical protein
LDEHPEITGAVLSCTSMVKVVVDAQLFRLAVTVTTYEPSVRPEVNAGMTAPEPVLVPLASPADAPPVQVNTVEELGGVDEREVELTSEPGQTGPLPEMLLIVVPTLELMVTARVDGQKLLSVTVTVYDPLARPDAVGVV